MVLPTVFPNETYYVIFEDEIDPFETEIKAIEHAKKTTDVNGCKCIICRVIATTAIEVTIKRTPPPIPTTR